MKYMIAIIVILFISLFMGFVLGAVASEEDPTERAMEDREQMEYLREWRRRRERS